MIEGYVNIHTLPMYTKKIAYGIKNFPWKSSFNKNKYIKKKEKLINAESLHKFSFFAIELCLHDFSEKDAHYIASCFKKTWRELGIK